MSNIDEMREKIVDYLRLAIIGGINFKATDRKGISLELANHILNLKTGTHRVAIIPEAEPPLLSPEEINKAYDRACNKWSEDGKTDVYEFNFLWQYIADEVKKAQLQLCKKHYEG